MKYGHKLLAMFFFTSFLGTQLLIPVAQLKSALPARFAWQMFSRVSAPRNFIIRDKHGINRKVKASNALGYDRSEINTEDSYPPYACKKFQQAKTISWIGSNGLRREYKCP